MKERKPNGYWKDFANVEQELKRIEQQLGHFPTSTDLRKCGQEALLAGIQVHHGGIAAVNHKLGHVSETKPMGYWKDFANVQNELNQITAKLGHFPTCAELFESGNDVIYRAIQTYHGGYRLIQQQNNATPLVHLAGHWKSLDNILAELEKVKSVHPFTLLPSKGELESWGYSYLARPIVLYHGGFSQLRKTLGETVLRKPDGYYQDIQVVDAEVKQIMSERNLTKVPSGKQLRIWGYATLAQVIATKHGGHGALRIRFGQDVARVPDGTYDDRDVVDAKVKEIMHQHNLTTVPGKSELAKLGYSSLAANVVKKHGGYRALRQRLGQEQVRVEDRQWEDEAYAIAKAKEIMAKEGWTRLPSTGTLAKKGYSALAAGINMQGGFYEFRIKLGEPTTRKKMGTWRNVEYVLEQCQAIMKENGWEELPGSWTLNKLKYVGIVRAINTYHDGMTVFRQKYAHILGNSQFPEGISKYRPCDSHKVRDEELQGLLLEYVK